MVDWLSGGFVFGNPSQIDLKADPKIAILEVSGGSRRSSGGSGSVPERSGSVPMHHSEHSYYKRAIDRKAAAAAGLPKGVFSMRERVPGKWRVLENVSC